MAREGYGQTCYGCRLLCTGDPLPERYRDHLERPVCWIQGIVISEPDWVLSTESKESTSAHSCAHGNTFRPFLILAQSHALHVAQQAHPGLLSGLSLYEKRFECKSRCKSTADARLPHRHTSTPTHAFSLPRRRTDCFPLLYSETDSQEVRMLTSNHNVDTLVA